MANPKDSAATLATETIPPLDVLLKAYNKVQKERERMRAYLQTEEGKAQNRAHAKAHYQKNREKILEQRKALWEADPKKMTDRVKSYYYRNRDAILQKLREKKALERARGDEDGSKPPAAACRVAA